MRGCRDNRDVFAGYLLLLADGSGDLKPAQLRHLHIHQDQVK